MQLVKVAREGYRLKGGNGKVCVLATALLVLFAGCGYTLNHRLKDEFQGHKGFFVPVFDNQTNEVGAEIVFTNALIYEMESHGEPMLSDREPGGIIVEGTLEKLTYLSETQSAPGFDGLHPHVRIPDQIGVSAVVALKMTDTRTGKVIWRNSFPGYLRTSAPQNRTRDIQAPSSLGLITQSLIEATYPDIARRMMRDVYDSLVHFN